MGRIHIAAATLHIGLNDQSRNGICNDLQVLLADEFVLYAKTRSFHWNVEGPHFGALHRLFEQQYGEIAVFIDDIAERIRQLGHYADGTLNGYMQRTQLQDVSGQHTEDMEMLRILTGDHETIIRSLRDMAEISEKQFKDKGTSDFLTQLMQKHEKMAWMLRSHIQ